MFDISRLSQIFKEKYDAFNQGAELRQLKRRGFVDRMNPFRNKEHDIKNAQSTRVESQGQDGQIFDKDKTNPIDNIIVRDSTALQDVKYNPNNGDLNVRFRGGRRYYTYPGVPEEEADGLKHANSKGRYFNENIKQYSINQ